MQIDRMFVVSIVYVGVLNLFFVYNSFQALYAMTFTRKPNADPERTSNNNHGYNKMFTFPRDP